MPLQRYISTGPILGQLTFATQSIKRIGRKIILDIMKHVWILNHYAQEPTGSGGTRHYLLSKYMVSHGWHATIIASSIEHSTGRQRLEGEQTKRLDSIDDVSFLWLKTSTYRNNGFKRIKNILQYTVKVLRPNSTNFLEKPDVIIGSSVHPLAVCAAWWLARRYKVPFIFEVRDLWPQTLIDMGRIKTTSPIAISLRCLEKFLYRKAKAIITLLPFAADYIEQLGIDRKKVTWISNGVDLHDYPRYCVTFGRKTSEPLRLMYFGAHGIANGLQTLIDAMAIIKERSADLDRPIATLRLIGDGPLKSNLIDHCIQYDLQPEYINFQAPVTKSKIPSLASEADAFVISVLNLPHLYRFGISMNKIFDYMAAAKPIIIASSANNDPIKDARAGITVPPDNPEALADAICELANMNSCNLKRMGLSGRQYVEENHSYDQLAQRLTHVLNMAVD